MLNKCIAYVCFLLLVSCGKDTDIKSKRLKFQVNKSVSIHLDSLSSVVLNRYQYKYKKIIILNNKKNSLDFYDFKDGGKIKERFFLEKEGENGVGIINDFLVHTSDSIFVLNCYQYKLFLINGQGKIIRKYNLIQGKISEETAMPDPFPFHPIVKINNKIYITSNPDRSPTTKQYYSIDRSLIELDIQTGSFTYKYQFPEIYKKNTYPYALNMISRAYSEHHKKFIYSFFADSCVRVVDIDHKKELAVLANSAEMSSVTPLKKQIFSEAENNIAADKTSFFSFIFHNPQNLETYRAFSIKKDKQKEKGGFIVLDSSFSKLGEVFMPVEKYHLLSIIFTPEGMWIQRFTDNEDELVYDLVEFVAE